MPAVPLQVCTILDNIVFDDPPPNNLHLTRQREFAVSPSASLVSVVKHTLALQTLSLSSPQSLSSFFSLFSLASQSSFSQSASHESAALFFNSAALLLNSAKTNNNPKYAATAAALFDSLTSSAAINSTLSLLALAVVQEQALKKAASLSNATIAKLAYAAAQYYAELIERINQPLQKPYAFPSHWAILISAKHKLYLATARVKHAAMAASGTDIGRFGLEIGLLRAAIEALATLISKDLKYAENSVTEVYDEFDNNQIKDYKGQLVLFQEYADMENNEVQEIRDAAQQLIESITPVLQAAEKDNDVVYMELIPQTLPKLPPAKMAKLDPTPLETLKSLLATENESFLSYPTTTHSNPVLMQTVDAYIKRRTDTVDSLLESVTTATQNVKTQLKSIGLPESLETMTKDGAKVLEILQHENENSPGLSFAQRFERHIETQLSSVRQWREWCVQVLEGAVRGLDVEASEDGELRGAFGIARMVGRQESIVLTRGLRETADNYFQKLDSASSVDQVVMQKIDDTKKRCLAVEAALKSDSTDVGIVAEKADEVCKLRNVLELLNDVFVKRTALEHEVENIKEADNILPKLVSESDAGVIINQASVIKEELRKYDSLIGKLEASLKSQDAIIALVIKRNSALQVWKKTNYPQLLKRDELIEEYRKCASSIQDIIGNLATGLKFYRDLKALLDAFAGNCRDYCLARSIERRELLERVQNSAVAGGVDVNFSFK